MQEDNTDADKESENDELSCSLVLVIASSLNVSISVWYENIGADNKAIKVEIDSGSEVNILPFLYNKYFKNVKLDKSNVVLQTFGGSNIKTLGSIHLNVVLVKEK